MRALKPRLLPCYLLPLVQSLAVAALAAGSEPARQSALAHLDSLHVARQVAAAEAFAAPLLESARAERDTAFILPLTAKLGRLWASFGQPARGEPLLREAAALALATDDSLALCDARRWLGYTLEQLGRFQEARRNYEDLLGAATARGDRRHQGWALVGMAFGDGRAGKITDSIAKYGQAAAHFAACGDAQAEIWTLNGLGTALQQAGRWNDARTCYLRVAEVADRTGYLAAAALAENNLGTLEFGQGDLAVARAHFAKAHRIQVEIDQRGEAVTSGTNIAVCAMQLGRFDEAVTRLEGLLELCREWDLQSSRPHLLSQLGRAQLKLDRPRQAAATFGLVLGLDPAGVTPLGLAEAIIGLADALAAQGRPGAALDSLIAIDRRRGADLVGEPRIQLDLSLGSYLERLSKPDEALRHQRRALAMARTTGLPKYELAALAGSAESWRTLDRPDSTLAALESSVPVWENLRRLDGDPQWREQRGPLARRIAAPLAVLTLGSPGGARAAFDAVQAFKARTLAERMFEQADRDPHLGGLAELQTRVLRKGELFLDTWLGPRESILFAVTRDSCAAVILPAAGEIEPRVRLVRDMLGTVPTAGDSPAGLVGEIASLGLDLLGCITPLAAGADHIIVAADGALNLVPWHLLMPRTGAAWSCVPSANILAALRQARSSDSESAIAALAGTTAPGGRTLAGTAEEVAHLARSYSRVTVLQPEDLDRGTGLPGSTPPGILHLAAHVQINDQQPWSSSLVLGNPEGADPSAAAIADWKLDIPLVVLSGCSTATGMVLSGEGVLGLTSAFLAAGAQVVVASLWPVDDIAAATFMQHFYRELAQGRPVASALAATRDHLESDPATAHPFYWAGFVASGDGGTLVRPQPRRSLLPFGIGLAAAAVVLGLAVRRRR